MNTKLFCAVLALTAGGVFTTWARPGDAVAFPAAGEPQVIHLDDGTKLTLLGATVGAHHFAPGYENLGTANWIYTAPGATVVWVQADRASGQTGPFNLLVSDRANTGCVSIEHRQGSFVKPGVFVDSFVLSAFPRWDPDMILRVKPYMGVPSKEQFVLANPAPVALTNWVAESLPDTQTNGDLEVTLTRLVAGAPFPYQAGQHPLTNDPANQCVHFDFNFRQNGLTVTNWRTWPIETFDAAGNHALGFILGYPSNGINPIYPDRVHPTFPLVYDGWCYRPGLWPDHSPWKVRMEFSRTSGFSADELWCVTNIPVVPGSQAEVNTDWEAEIGSTNFVFAETTIGGIHLKLYRGLQFTADSDGQKHITVLVKADPFPRTKGIELTIARATDEQNRDLDHFWGGTTDNFPFEPTWVHDAKSLNLTIAVQKPRYVDFTVNPTKQ